MTDMVIAPVYTGVDELAARPAARGRRVVEVVIGWEEGPQRPPARLRHDPAETDRLIFDARACTTSRPT